MTPTWAHAGCLFVGVLLGWLLCRFDLHREIQQRGIILALLTTHGELTGRQMRDLGASYGLLYSRLYQLEREGVVESRECLAGPLERNGARRRIYKLKGSGG